MSHFLGVQQLLGRSILRLNIHVQYTNRAIEAQRATASAFVRFASRSNQPTSAPKSLSPKQPTRRREIEGNNRGPQPDTSRKASLLLNRLTQVSNKTLPDEIEEPSQTGTGSRPAAVVESHSDARDEDASKPIEIDEHEEAIQSQIVKNRTKLFWPGIWTFFALTGTYGALAYLDARYNVNVLSGTTQLPEHTELSQAWFLTPKIVKEGLQVGWNELDKLTIGIIVASAGIHFLKKSPLPFWEKFIHITGEKKYTAFTYPFVHSNWAHLTQNMFALCWFMPGVVRYLDGDLFHTAALFTSVPLLTTYFQHFAFRWGSVTGIPLNVGSSGAVAAMLGAFCVAYPGEKVWLPSFVILRLDAIYWGVLFATWQLASMAKTPKGGNRPAYLVHVVSLSLGAAYVYFDGKNNIWRPLTSRFANTGTVIEHPMQS